MYALDNKEDTFHQWHNSSDAITVTLKVVEKQLITICILTVDVAVS